MTTAVYASAQELEAKEAVLALTPPAGVRFKSLFLDVDHSGDPAVYVVFVLAKDYGTTPAKIRALNALRDQVGERLNEIFPDRFNYVRFSGGR